MKGRFKAAVILATVSAVCGVSGAVTAFADQTTGTAYYVCYSNENYAVRNANKLSEKDGEYVLSNVRLNSLISFYVTDNAGRRWYAGDGKEMQVEETANYYYDIKFSPENTYATEEGGWEKTDCHITYAFYVPAQYSVNIGGTETPLTYNPYRTAYDEYFLSSQYITGGTDVIFGTETHNIADDGYYRILYTPGEMSGGNAYAYDENGNYGTGEKFTYNLYIQDAPQYFLLPEGETEYVPLTRNENNVAASEYQSEEFFITQRDTTYRYAVYEMQTDGVYRLIDDDGDEDTALSKINAEDAGWYKFSFTDGGSVFATSLKRQKRNFKGFYLAGEFNNYGFDGQGNVYTDEDSRLTVIADGDDDYDKDFTQYAIDFTVTEKQLNGGDFEFYITDGDAIYKNGAHYIAISRAGEYRLLFSDEHFYGNGRRYRYVLLDGKKDYTEIEIGTAEEFIDFAKKCTASADYSKDKAVYITKDIDFAGVNFVGVGEFSGRFYGGYHNFKNVTLSADQPSVFNIVKRDGLVERLNVNINCTDKNAEYVAAVGRNYGTVSGVTVTGSISGNNYVGGVVAYNGRSPENETSGSADTNTVYRLGLVQNCKNLASVSGSVHCGGICGFNAGEVTACTNQGKVNYLKQSSSSANFNLGGVCGYSAGKITDCTNVAEVNGGSEVLYVGGICGLCTGEVYFCFNSAPVSARRYAGGIIGYFGTINSENDRNDIFGGLSIEDIYNRYFGDDTSFEEAQGEANIITYCKNTGAVTSVSYAGGVLGYSDAAVKISACISEGEVAVTAGSYAGGIAAYFTGANAIIQSCYSYGNVSAKGLNGGKYVGGIAGYGNGISSSFSVCRISGEDYLGGIAGYNQSGLNCCWANVIIIGDGENVGNISGFTEALNNAADSFNSGFAYNYYIENEADSCGGVGRRSYGKNYDFAACDVASADLAFGGTVSPYLAKEFNDGGNWQGTDEVAYPVPVSFFEAEECKEFGDDTAFAKLFENHSQKFGESVVNGAKVLYTISFLEWNEDNGKLYDDGELQLDNFDLISSIRLPSGSQITLPAFKYAQQENGRYVYYGDEARYFVTFTAPQTVNGNIKVYATYREIATTVATDGDRVLAEGLFDAETKIELITTVNGYALKFTLNGEQVKADGVKIKFRPENGSEGCKVVIHSPDGTRRVCEEISGDCVVFTYSDGEYFTIEKDESAGIPSWGWALIGGTSVAALAAVAFVTVFAVKKKRAKIKDGGKANEE